MRCVKLLLCLVCGLWAQAPPVEKIFEAAVAAQERGDFQSAEQQYRALLRAHPQAVPVRVNLGSVLAAENKFDEAVSILLPAEAALKQDVDIAWVLGNAMINAGRLVEGVHRIELVAAHGNADARLLAAETHLRLDQYDEALKQVDAALTLSPKLPHAHSLRGMILEHSGDLPASVLELEKALAADATDANAHLYLGAILLYRRQLEPAHQHLDQAVSLDPESSLARYQLALVRLAEGDAQTASKDLEEVVRRNPQWLQPHVTLAAVYYRLNRREDGVRERKIVDLLNVQSKSVTQPFIAPAP